MRNKKLWEMETQEGNSSHEVEFRAGGGKERVLVQMNQGSKRQENGHKVNIWQKGIKIAPEQKYFILKTARKQVRYRAETFIEIICFLFSGKLCEYGTVLAYGNISFDLLKVYWLW